MFSLNTRVIYVCWSALLDLHARAPERAEQRLLDYSNVAEHDLVVERRYGRAGEGSDPEDPLQIKTRTGHS